MESVAVGNNEDQQQQGGNNNNKGGSSTSSNNNNNFLCRQSSTRWTPTTDQIRILKDLYYNNGVRSPTAEQIQRISAKLRQYGKIEGKNVFYWFQNHKARERQKKRFTTSNTTTDHFNIIPNFRPQIHHHAAAASSVATGFIWNNNTTVNDHYDYNNNNHVSPVYNKFPYINTSTTAFQGGASSTAYFNGGSMFNNDYGSMAMETNFRERSLMGYKEDCSSSNHAIETLPLFPMHDEIKHQQDCYLNINSYGINNGHDWHNNSNHIKQQQTPTCPRASLELTLNCTAFANQNMN